MSSFLIRRLAFVLVSLIGATAVVFALSRMAGDPILLYAKPYGYGDTEKYLDELRRHMGLDQPLVVQYAKWVWQLAQGDLGLTLLSRRPVIDVINEKIWNTFQLAFTGWFFATVLGVPLGVLSAVKRGTFWDYIGRGFALFGQALPAFWVGVMLVLIFAVTWNLLPAAFKAPTDDQYGFHPEYFILPTITIGWGAAAGYLRITRSAMLEVLDSEFVKLARAKGRQHQRGDLEARFQERANSAPDRIGAAAGRPDERRGGGGSGVRMARAWKDSAGGGGEQQRLPAADGGYLHLHHHLFGDELRG